MLFDLLADPTRRGVLELLRSGDRSVTELVAALGVSQPALSRHLRVLRDAGLVHATAVAQRRIYSLRPEKLQQLDAWLEPYRLLWSGRLDALEDHLHRMGDMSSDCIAWHGGAARRRLCCFHHRARAFRPSPLRSDGSGASLPSELDGTPTTADRAPVTTR